MYTRRSFGAIAGGTILTMILPTHGRASTTEKVVISAPSNLGLRPLRPEHVPGTWRAPEVLSASGFLEAVGAKRGVTLARPLFEAGVPNGSRIRNGPELRKFNEALASSVRSVIAAGEFPIVLGGDCSILLGCLAGARRDAALGLVHIDGHSDFFHPGNYDADSRLGSAAGMDLALATGRGEPLLTLWNGACLVADKYVSQIGEREELDADYAFRDIEDTEIRRFPVRSVHRLGISNVVENVLAPVGDHKVPLWLHVDLDVLDAAIMPAVDSPGSPGLSFDQLSQLVGGLLASDRIVGLDIAIYDPDLDPSGENARSIVACFAEAFAKWKH